MRSPTCWDGSNFFGDAELVGWIEQYKPDIVLSGHIHQSPFQKGGSWVDRIGNTWVFNAGRQIGPCPTHIVFDTDVGCAVVLAGRWVRPSCLNPSLLWSRTELKLCPVGSVDSIVRVTNRARLEFLDLLVEQRLKHLVHHAKVVIPVFELAFQIGKVAGNAVQLPG